MASMMLAFFSKFLYVFIVVSFILCGHIQYNMQMKKIMQGLKQKIPRCHTAPEDYVST